MRLIKKPTVNIDIKDARPASDVINPSACIRYPRLTQKPNSIPEFRVSTSSRACKINGMNRMVDTENLIALKAAGSTIASTSFRTGMLLATIFK